MNKHLLYTEQNKIRFQQNLPQAIFEKLYKPIPL